MLRLEAGLRDMPAPEFLNLRNHPQLAIILHFALDCKVSD